MRCLLLPLLCIPACAVVNVQDYGAQGDGIANDTVAMNSAFNAACAASEDVYIPEGTYAVESLTPLKDCGVTFSGAGTKHTTIKLIATDRRPMWPFVGNPGKALVLTIQDLSIDGGHFSEAGIAIEGYRAVLIKRVFGHDFGTPGYRLGHRKELDGLYIRNAENVRVTDSEFTGNERYGIELQAVHSSIVRDSTLSSNGGMGGVSEQNFDGPLDGPLVAQWIGNTLVGNGSGGIDVETDPKLPPAQGILQGNQVINCGDDKWDAGWALVLGLHSFGTIEHNAVQNFAAHAAPDDYTNAIVYGQSAGPIAILNNMIIGTKSRAISGNNGVSSVAITGNTLTENGTGIFIYNSPHVRITNNTVMNNVGDGIILFLSDGSTITGNLLTGNTRNLRVNGHDAKQNPG